MQTRQLGRSELTVPVVTFGAWALGGGYWGATDDDAAIAALRHAVDLGMTAIDTAPIYGLGHSERLIGRALAGRRDEVKLLTKVGLRWDCEDGDLFFESKQGADKPLKVYRNSRPESVRLEVERSLERLGVEHLDLVQVHWPDPTTPVADTMGALAELVREGKVGAVGVSNYDTTLLAEAATALGAIPLASDQPRYSLVHREIEQDILPWVLEHDVGVLVYSPLEQGLLTGRVRAGRSFGEDEGRSRRPSFRPANRAAVNAVLDEVVAPIAAELSATIAQVIIAWTVARPGVTAALVGARTPEQVSENVRAGELVLSDEAWAAIDRAFAGLSLDLSED